MQLNILSVVSRNASNRCTVQHYKIQLKIFKGGLHEKESGSELPQWLLLVPTTLAADWPSLALNLIPSIMSTAEKVTLLVTGANVPDET